VRVHPVGIYIALAGLLITAILLLRLRDRTRDGDIAASALVLSGLAQFVVTFVREPAFFDNALGRILDPIQWVALVMIAAGALIWQQPRRHVAV
jgi:phosphatidylglycerol---prolipoprotein diacylglyceryl transferase